MSDIGHKGADCSAVRLGRQQLPSVPVSASVHHQTRRCGSKHNKRYDSTGLLSDKYVAAYIQVLYTGGGVKQLIYRYCTQVVEYTQLVRRSPGM
jgi:hypothetical protein